MYLVALVNSAKLTAHFLRFQIVHSSSQKEADFHVGGLSPGANFTLAVFASSARGRGEPHVLQVGTVTLIPDRIGEWHFVVQQCVK